MPPASKRIMLVSTSLGFGGAEAQVMLLSLELKKRGWDVSACSLLALNGHAIMIQQTGGDVLSLGMRRGVPDPRAVFRLRAAIRRFRPSIVHSHQVHANLLTRVTRWLCPAPVVISTVHSIQERSQHRSGTRLRELAYRYTDRLADATTCICRIAADRYTKIGAACPERLFVVPNAVDVQAFSPDPVRRVTMRRELGYENRFVWLAASRLEEVKDYPSMLRAFAMLHQSSPQAVLMIAGVGSCRARVEAEIAALGLSSAVRLLGFRPDVPHLMNAADGFVLSSFIEGMPTVLLEAGASGLPVVSTRAGGASEVVVDGRTGFLIPVADTAALAERLIEVTRMPADALRLMGDTARRYVQAEFSIERITDIWERLYSGLYTGRSNSYSSRGK